MERNITVILHIIIIMLFRSRYVANWCKAATRLVMYTFHLVFKCQTPSKRQTDKRTDKRQPRASIPQRPKANKANLPFHSPHFSIPFHFLYFVSPP